jgi:hypothetical protein
MGEEGRCYDFDVNYVPLFNQRMLIVTSFKTQGNIGMRLDQDDARKREKKCNGEGKLLQSKALDKETLRPIDMDDGRPECQRGRNEVEKVTERRRHRRRARSTAVDSWRSGPSSWWRGKVGGHATSVDSSRAYRSNHCRARRGTGSGLVGHTRVRSKWVAFPNTRSAVQTGSALLPKQPRTVGGPSCHVHVVAFHIRLWKSDALSEDGKLICSIVEA